MIIKYKYSYPGTVGYKTWDSEFGTSVVGQGPYKFGINVDGVLRVGAEGYNYAKSFNIDEALPVFVKPRLNIPPTPEQIEAGYSPILVYPNPNYEAELAAWNEAEATALSVMRGLLCLTKKVRFPSIPDSYSGIRWWRYNFITSKWEEEEVIVGRYPGEARWVDAAEPESPQYEGFLRLISPLGDNKDKMLRKLFAIK